MMTRVGVFLFLVTSVTALSQPPVIFSEPAYEVYYVVGKSVQLSCVANGEPRPQYRWKRNEIAFSPSGNDARIVQLPNAGTLVFNSAIDKDEGIYQCFATNSLGTAASKKAKLIQAKLAEFAYASPQNFTPKIGEPFTLPCVPPQSVPPALAYWINLEELSVIDPYNYDERVSMDREFRLRFANVRAEDRKGGLAYVCAAMNPVMRQTALGPLYYISPIGPNNTVASVKYLWADQDDRFGLVGDTFSMKCIFSGNPTPDVHWERHGNKTLPDRASLKSFGQELEISNLQFEDAGSYQCWATNYVSVGPREIRTFNVRVNSKPDFLEKPKDIETGFGANVEFTCIAKGVPEPDIEWFIDGVTLRGVTDPRITGPRFKRPLETKIVLENVQLSDHMVVQCNASNIYGYVFANAFLNVLASPVPDAPTQVTLESCKVNATISWLTGSNNATDYFVVEYNTSFNPDKWILGRQVNSTVNRVNFTLSPFVNYTFRVIAYNEVGVSKPSNPTTKVCVSKPNRPAYSPRNLRTVGDHSGKLYVEWTPVPEYDQSGPGFYYILRILRVGAQAETDTITIPINDRKVNHYEMSTGYVYTPYNITLTAGNNVGAAAADPSTIIGYSYESTPSITPTKLVAVEVGPTYVVFQWEFDRSEIGKANTTIHGEFRGFRIWLSVRTVQSSTPVGQHDIGPESANNATGNIFNARVENLLPNTFMVAQISVKNNFYTSSAAYIGFKTLTGSSLVPDAPTQVIWEWCNVNATISWLPGSNNATDYFVVEYNTSFNPDKWIRFRQVNSTVNRVNFTLSPFVNYTFRVIAYNEVGVSKPSNPTPKVCATKPNRPAYHPRNLRTVGDHYGKLYVEWTPVPEYDQGGPGFFYIIRILRVGAPAETDTQEIPINDWTINHYEMSTGYVYEPYRITLRAGNSVGSPAADPSTIIGYSYESTPSITPTKLVAAEVGPTYVVFQWEFDRSEIGKANTTIHGEFRGFQIVLSVQNVTTLTPVRQHDIGPESANNATGNIFNARVENLLTNTFMMAQISVKNNFYTSSEALIVFKTLAGCKYQYVFVCITNICVH